MIEIKDDRFSVERVMLTVELSKTLTEFMERCSAKGSNVAEDVVSSISASCGSALGTVISIFIHGNKMSKEDSKELIAALGARMANCFKNVAETDVSEVLDTLKEAYKFLDKKNLN